MGRIHNFTAILALGALLFAPCDAHALSISGAVDTLEQGATALVDKGTDIANQAGNLAQKTYNAASAQDAYALADTAKDFSSQAKNMAGTATNIVNTVQNLNPAGIVNSVKDAAIGAAKDYAVNTGKKIIEDSLGLSAGGSNLATQALDFARGGNIDTGAILTSATSLMSGSINLGSTIQNLASSGAISSLASLQGATLIGGAAGDVLNSLGGGLLGGGSKKTLRETQKKCAPGLPCVEPSSGSPVSGINALKSGSAGCDADFMNQVYAQAWGRANQEMTAAQIGIKKSDSVLEYACFDEHLGIAANQLAKLFSESADFSNRTYKFYKTGTSISKNGKGTYDVNMKTDKADKSLKGLVLSALTAHRDGNFSHDFLGGTLIGENSPPSLALGGGDYTCNIMSTVETISKCSDFGTDNPFYTLDELAQSDLRAYPQACPGEYKPPDFTAIADNEGFQYASFDVPSTYPELLSAGSCGPAIPTGLTVTEYTASRDLSGPPSSTGKQWPDYICPNPGCYYDKTAKSCKQ